MGVECTFSFLLKIIVSLHILELEVFSSLAGISLLLLPLENARRDFIWSFKVLYKHQCLKYLYSYLQLEFFKKLPAISLKLEFNLRVKCAPKPWLCSVWFCQICMELCGSCIFFQPKKTICVQKWTVTASSEYTGLNSSCISQVQSLELLTLTFATLKISLCYIIKVYLCIRECIYEEDWEIRSTLSQGITFIEVLEGPYWS